MNIRRGHLDPNISDIIEGTISSTATGSRSGNNFHLKAI